MSCIRTEGWKRAKLQSQQTQKKRKQERIDKYLRNPLLCKQCGKPLDYKHRKNLFCDPSCSASYSNKQSPRTGAHTLSAKGLENIIKTNQKRKGFPGKQRKREKIKFCTICGKDLPYQPGKHRKTCSRVCYLKALANRAKKTGLGGNHNHRAEWYESPIAGRVWLESSYEIRVAKILDENKIQWCRPKSIKWIDSSGTIKRYYPDFLLSDYEIYLDPKNQYLQTVDREKIRFVIQQNKIKLVILGKEDLNIERLQEVIEVLKDYRF